MKPIINYSRTELEHCLRASGCQVYEIESDQDLIELLGGLIEEGNAPTIEMLDDKTKEIYG